MAKQEILISPYSKEMRNGKRNPKNYPWWNELIKILKAKGYSVTQLGVYGEKTLDADKFMLDKSLKELENAIDRCTTWLSVDNFFHHYCFLLGKPGVVIFGKSDPKIFGHSGNINLLKDRAYLRENQFDIWEREEYSEDCFVDPLAVAKAVFKLTKEKK